MNTYKKIVSIVLFTGLASISSQQVLAVKKETQVAVKEDNSKLIDLPKELIIKILGMSLEKKENYKNIGEVLLFKKLIDQEVMRRNKMDELDFSDLTRLERKIERLKILAADFDAVYKSNNGYEHVFLLAKEWNDEALLKMLLLAPGYPFKVGTKIHEKMTDKICFVRKKNGSGFIDLKDIDLHSNFMEKISEIAKMIGFCDKDSFDKIVTRKMVLPLGSFYKAILTDDIPGIKKLLDAGVFPYGNFIKIKEKYISLYELEDALKNNQDVDEDNKKTKKLKKYFFDFICGQRDFFWFDIHEKNLDADGAKKNLKGLCGNLVFSNGDLSLEKISLLCFSPLHAAAYLGNLEMVKLFIEEGVDVNFKTWDITPLFIAALRGHQEIVEYLLEQGARIQETCYKGKTVLHNAFERGDMDMITLLLKKLTKQERKDALLVKDQENKAAIEYLKPELMAEFYLNMRED